MLLLVKPGIAPLAAAAVLPGCNMLLLAKPGIAPPAAAAAACSSAASCMVPAVSGSSNAWWLLGCTVGSSAG
jgi:hypothetical protein